jgi:hypothetical protein
MLDFSLICRRELFSNAVNEGVYDEMAKSASEQDAVPSVP